MSDLRKQLQKAREQYRSQRYPGDLAAELLERPARRSLVFKLFVGGVGVSGIAAAIALWMMVTSPTSPTRTQPGGRVAVVSPPVVAVASTQPSDAVAPITELAAVPEFPQDIPMAPTLESGDVPMAPVMDSMELGSMPSMPSMPSFDMSFSETDSSPTQTQNSKEST